MANLIKKLILWINENPKLSVLIAITSCIPVAIIFALLGLEVLAIVFGILAFFGTCFWLSVVIVLIIHGLETLWKKLVAWAEK